MAPPDDESEIRLRWRGMPKRLASRRQKPTDVADLDADHQNQHRAAAGELLQRSRNRVRRQRHAFREDQRRSRELRP